MITTLPSCHSGFRLFLHFCLVCSVCSFDLVKKNLLGAKKGFWGFVETLEKASGEMQETISAVKAIPGIKYVHVTCTYVYTA